VFVDFENNLNTAVARLREALGDSAEHPRFIETLPKRGYRFIGDVFTLPAAAVQVPVQRARLLVLPFVNLTGDPAQEYVSDAITDEIITELASLVPGQLSVIARTTAMHYKGSHKDVSRIGSELGVDYVVEGSVRRTEDGIATNVQFIQTSDQTHLFATKYAAALGDIFNMQHSIAQTIAAHLPGIADRTRAGVIGVARRARKRIQNLAAYSEYIQGRHDIFKLTPEVLATAKQHLERAIALDPEFALGHDALAEFYWILGYVGLVSPREAFSAGMAHARRAIEIDDSLAETHALLGQFHKTVDYDWPEVHREMTLALRLDPDSPLVRTRYAVSWLMPQGCLEDAAAELERALEFDPLSFEVRYWLAIMLLLSGRYQRGIEECQKILDLDPDYPLAHFAMSGCYRYLKMFDEALAALRRAVELSGGSALTLGWLGLALAESGETARARDVLRRLHGDGRAGLRAPVQLRLGPSGAQGNRYRLRVAQPRGRGMRSVDDAHQELWLPRSHPLRPALSHAVAQDEPEALSGRIRPLLNPGSRQMAGALRNRPVQNSSASRRLQ
ncbi:MAG: tetratricopeptide repeat protein, partial [Bryobacteraceae bacterium]